RDIAAAADKQRGPRPIAPWKTHPETTAANMPTQLENGPPQCLIPGAARPLPRPAEIPKRRAALAAQRKLNNKAAAETSRIPRWPGARIYVPKCSGYTPCGPERRSHT